MTDPVVVVTSAKILDLAFNEFIKSSAGEAAKKMTDEAFTKVNELRQKILSWFQKKKHHKAVIAISEIQSTKSVVSFDKLATYLSDEMDDSPDFAQELQQIVQQITSIQRTTQLQNQESTINNLSGNAKITSGNDNSLSGNSLSGNAKIIYGNDNSSSGNTKIIHGNENNGGHIGDNYIYQSASPKPGELLNIGIKLLGRKSYSEAQDLFEDVIKNDPSISDAYYYLSIALMSGEKPNNIDSWTIKKIEKYLESSIVGNDNPNKCYILWATVKYGYYKMNGFKDNAPTSFELLDKVYEDLMQSRQAEELLTNLNRQDSSYWMNLQNQLDGSKQ